MGNSKRNGQLIAGLVIAGLGLVLALQNVLDFRIWNFYPLWPLILVAFGIVRLLSVDERRHRSGALVVIAVGLWLLLNTLEIGGLDWGESWPILLMLLGLAKIVLPEDGRRSSGVLLILVGVWAFLNVFEIWGLHWGNSWSIALIAFGLFIVWRALFEERKAPARKGD